MYRFKLRAPLLKQAKEFCQREGVSLFHIMFATFAALLRRYSGEDQIPVGIVTARRKHPEAESLLGYFLNTVVVPTEMSGDPSFRTLIQRARDWSVEAMDHDQMPFEHLVRELKVQREPTRNPLFQALFSMESLPEIPHGASRKWTWTQERQSTTST
jgi:non-ribosomal peptide synthetase component F